MNELMQAVAQSDFFYYWVATHIGGVKIAFFVMLFLMIGALADFAREADREQWWKEVQKQDAEAECGREV